MAELRRVEEVLGDTRRQLKAVEGEEEALRAKVGHLRHEADIAQAACDRARAAEADAVKARRLGDTPSQHGITLTAQGMPTM